jgi:uncharacterized membrane protein
MVLNELQRLNLIILAVGLVGIIFLVHRMVKVIRKYYPRYTHYLYLFIALLSFVEIILTLIRRPLWYDQSWFLSPFLYFWLILVVYFGLSFFLKSTKK